MGTRWMIDAARSAPQSTPIIAPVNSAIVIGAVRIFQDVKISAYRNSFQAKIAAKITTVTNPGAARGKVILKNAPNLEQPSRVAASSSSTGISSINDFIIHVVRLTRKAEYRTTSVTYLSINPKVFNRGNMGMVITMGGSILTTIRKNAGTLKNLALKREKVNAAVTELKSVNNPVKTVIIRLFFR